MSKISFAFETDPGDAEGLVVLQNLVSALTGLTRVAHKTTEVIQALTKVVEPIKAPDESVVGDSKEAAILTKTEIAAKVYPDRTDGGKFPEPLLKETDEERDARITENKAAIIKQKTAQTVGAGAPAPKEDASAIKVEDLRALLSKKVEKNRAACKAKLVALGASSITLLNQADYQDMFDFLSSLE